MNKDEVTNAYAISLIRKGNYTQAETVLRKILQHSPHFTAARMNLSNLALEQGDTKTALREFQKLLREGNNSPDLYYNLGRALAVAGRFMESLEAFKQCQAKNPHHPLLPIEIGNVLRKLGRQQEARTWYQQASIKNPHHPGIWINISNSFLDEDNFTEASVAIRKAIRLDPNYAEAWSNLCAINLRQGFLEVAEQAGRKAVALNPRFAGAYRNLTQVLMQKGDLDSAYLCLYQESILLNASIETKLRLIRLLGERSCYTEAAELEHNLGTAIHTIPDLGLYLFAYRRAICDWRNHSQIEQQVATYIKTAKIDAGMQLSPWMALQVEGITATELRIYTENVAAYLFKGFAPSADFSNINIQQKKLPLRIGYLSADFHAHATTYLMIEVFEQHNRAQFETFAYSIDADDNSPIRQRLTNSFAHWRDVSTLSARDTAALIQADHIDLLIDLKGYTQNARPEVLVLRSAPIQISYLGYPGTVGTKDVDYLLADTFIIPPTHQHLYTEKIAYLPDCYQANSSHREVAPPISRLQENLPEQGLILCCFNHPRKISPKLFDIWCKVLKAVPETILWLLAMNALVEKNLRTEAKAHGVDSSQLVFAPRRPQAEHLSRLALADLFLDTYPVNAHTTASDALYMGVPLVTCVGDTFASRVAGSLLRTCGLEDLITENLQAYEDLIIQLVQNPSSITALKRRLAKNLQTSALFDSYKFTRNLENLYLQLASF